MVGGLVDCASGRNFFAWIIGQIRVSLFGLRQRGDCKFGNHGYYRGCMDTLYLWVCQIRSRPLITLFTMLGFALFTNLVAGGIGLVVYGTLIGVSLGLHFLLLMCLAAPDAMVAFKKFLLSAHYARKLLERIKTRLHQLTIPLWSAGKKRIHARLYSTANLFSAAAVPYQLYPLSCVLLE